MIEFRSRGILWANGYRGAQRNHPKMSTKWTKLDTTKWIDGCRCLPSPTSEFDITFDNQKCWHKEVVKMVRERGMGFSCGILQQSELDAYTDEQLLH